MLTLRRGIVVAADPPRTGGMQSLDVSYGDEARPALADISLVGESQAGDEVVTNTAAVDLELGSGGFDLVHVNLTRGLGREGVEGAHVMKLNYSSLQHAVLPIEQETKLELPLKVPVGVFFLHGQLPAVAWALAKSSPGLSVGYVQTAGGALPGGLSRTVQELLDRGLLSGHVTAGQCYGGRREAITTAGGIYHGIRDLGWDIVLCGPGPGILGSSSALGHGGIVALESAQTALALGAKTVLIPRMSSGDPRPRHQGLSHHAATTLSLLREPVTVAVPAQTEVDFDRHMPILGEDDVDGYAESGLPTTTMGRSISEDRLFFSAALAGGTVLAKLVRDE